MARSTVPPARAAVALEKERQVMALRLAGMSNREIADFSTSNPAWQGPPIRGGARAVSQLVRRILERDVQEPAEAVRGMEIRRLDGLLKTWYPRATGSTPDKDAAVIVLKVLDRRYALLGLLEHAPSPTFVNVQLGGPHDPGAVAAAKKTLGRAQLVADSGALTEYLMLLCRPAQTIEGEVVGKDGARLIEHGEGGHGDQDGDGGQDG